MAYTKLDIAAPPGPDSREVLVRKSIKLVASIVRWRWIFVPGLCGKLIASSTGSFVACVPFVTTAEAAFAAIVDGKL